MRTLMATGLLGAAVALSSFPGVSAQTLPVQAPSNPAPGPPSNPVKDQPAPPAPGCSFRPLSAGEVRVVDTEPNGPSWWWGQALAVDPWNPCQMYMTVGSTDGSKYPYALMRGTAQGTTTTWSQVFHMPTEPEEAGSSAVSLGARGLTPVPLVTRPGMAWLAGATMGPLTAPAYFFEAYGQSPPPALTRVFRTADSGSHWTENDNGLLVHSVRSGYTRLLAAPADPQTLYLLSINEHSNAMISVTHDGGQSWQLPAQLPAPDTANSEAWKVAPYAVDPGAAGRLFYLQMGPTQLGPSQPYSQTTDSAAQVLWESSDSGSTWTPHPSPGAFSGAVVDELFATHPAGRGPDVYAHVLSGNTEQSTGQWYRTRDLGTTWTALPLPQDGPVCPAGSPVGDAQGNCNDSSRFLTYPGSLLVPARNDPNTLVWIGRSPTSSLSGSLQVLATTDGFAGRPLVREQIAGPGFPSVESLQSDASGDFFLAAEFAAGTAVSDTVIAFRPPVQSGGSVATGTAAPIAAPAPAPPPPQPTTGTPVPTKATCIVPSAVGGSVAFDGRFVDYTQTTAEPGVIRRFDAATCAIAPSLVLNPADFGSGSTPVLTALTYDALFRWQSGQQGAILGAGLPGTEPSVPAVRAPIYAVNPVTAAARLLFFEFVCGGTLGMMLQVALPAAP